MTVISVYIYDEALVSKLKSWTENTQIQVYGPNETSRMFQTIADKTEDKPIQLPIICLSRRGGYSLSNPNKRVMSYDGITKDANDKVARQINAIPISIPYQIDVYARYLKEADSFMRDIVFNIINHPTFKVVIPYQGINLEHNANMILSSDIEDNSDIPERLVTGQFYRMSLTFVVDDAYLWDVRDRGVVTMSGDGLYIEVRKDDEDYIIEKISV